jgi:ABC-type multidrug transport system permease subunit
MKKDVAQSIPMKELEDMGFFVNDGRMMHDSTALGAALSNVKVCTEEKPPPGMIVQTRMLFQREVRNLRRDTTAMAGRFGLAIFMSVLVGIIFYDVGKSNLTVSSHLQSHFGAVLILLMMGMFGTAQPALLAFPQEHPVFLREYSTNHYSVVSYFVSRLTMEAVVTAVQVLVNVVVVYWLVSYKAGFPTIWATSYTLAMASTALAVLIGSSVEDPKVAQEFLPALFVPQFLFAGFFVTPSLIPVWLRWARYICTLTYAVRIFLVAEFKECARRQRGCAKLLDDVGAHTDETWWYWLILVSLFVLFRVFALFMLRKKATKSF